MEILFIYKYMYTRKNREDKLYGSHAGEFFCYRQQEGKGDVDKEQIDNKKGYKVCIYKRV